MIGAKVAVLHVVAGTLVPLIVTSFMTRFFGRNRSFAEGLRIWRFALFAAFAMTVPYLAAALLLGPEFPSLFGGLIAIVAVVNGFSVRGGAEGVGRATTSAVVQAITVIVLTDMVFVFAATR